MKNFTKITLSSICACLLLGGGFGIGYVSRCTSNPAPPPSEKVIDESLLEIEEGVLCGFKTPYNYSWGTKLVVPDGVTEISHIAFQHIPLTSVTFPDSLTWIDSSAFNYCTALHCTQ